MYSKNNFTFILNYTCKLVLPLLILIACTQKTKETPVSIRKKKETKLISPAFNDTLIYGQSIHFKIATIDTNKKIDSIIVHIEKMKLTFTNNTFDMNLPSEKVGNWRVYLKVFLQKNKTESHSVNLIQLPAHPPKQLVAKIINIFPHDPTDYTQGLLIHDNFLYESTGRKSKSTFKKKEIETGKVLKTVHLSKEYFGEGLASFNDKFYQLTWTSGTGFIYNIDMEQVGTFNYATEGWGLTAFKDCLIMTTKTEEIYFIKPANFTIQKKIEVYNHIGKVMALNELEVIDELIYANVYQKDIIVAIDPNSGAVIYEIDLSSLLSTNEKRKADVLNGIAYDPITKRTFITGKLWAKLFEVQFVSKKI